MLSQLLSLIGLAAGSIPSEPIKPNECQLHLQPAEVNVAYSATVYNADKAFEYEATIKIDQSAIKARIESYTNRRGICQFDADIKPAIMRNISHYLAEATSTEKFFLTIPQPNGKEIQQTVCIKDILHNDILNKNKWRGTYNAKLSSSTKEQ